MHDTVEFTRAEYVANLEMWRMVSDACAGEQAVKARGEDYLPRPNPIDKSHEATARYCGYLQRAVYYNACGRTLAGLVGLAFGKDPNIQAPGKIEYLVDDADGARLPLIGSASATMSEVLKTGRAGVMVDFPNRKTTATAQDVANGDARATLQFYPASSIINWRSERIGASLVLTLVVLREIENKWDEFGMTSDTIYRVLRLQDGVYWQEVWRTDNTDATGKKIYKLDELFIPTDANGKQWSEIPFAFVGAVSNHSDIESHNWAATSTPFTTISPMYDIAVLNMAHFRNSADYEDSVFLCGQPQPWVSGLDVEWRDKLISSGITLGSRVILPLPVGGQFGLAQANANQLVAAAMKQKEDQMRALGAKLVQPFMGSRTATQANHEASTDNSVLSLVCDNVSRAYSRALQWAAQFMGEEGETGFSIDTQFSVNPLDAQSIQAVVAAWQAGAIPQTDMWDAMRKMAIIDPSKTDDDILAELEPENAQRETEELAAMTPKSNAAIAATMGQST